MGARKLTAQERPDNASFAALGDDSASEYGLSVQSALRDRLDVWLERATLTPQEALTATARAAELRARAIAAHEAAAPLDATGALVDAEIASFSRSKALQWIDDVTPRRAGLALDLGPAFTAGDAKAHLGMALDAIRAVGAHLGAPEPDRTHTRDARPHVIVRIESLVARCHAERRPATSDGLATALADLALCGRQNAVGVMLDGAADPVLAVRALLALHAAAGVQALDVSTQGQRPEAVSVDQLSMLGLSLPASDPPVLAMLRELRMVLKQNHARMPVRLDEVRFSSVAIERNDEACDDVESGDADALAVSRVATVAAMRYLFAERSVFRPSVLTVDAWLAAACHELAGVVDLELVHPESPLATALFNGVIGGDRLARSVRSIATFRFEPDGARAFGQSEAVMATGSAPEGTSASAEAQVTRADWLTQDVRALGASLAGALQRGKASPATHHGPAGSVVLPELGSDPFETVRALRDRAPRSAPTTALSLGEHKLLETLEAQLAPLLRDCGHAVAISTHCDAQNRHASAYPMGVNPAGEPHDDAIPMPGDTRRAAGRIEPTQPSDIDATLATLRDGAVTARRTPARERAREVDAFLNALEAASHRLLVPMIAEAGLTLRDALNELHVALERARSVRELAADDAMRGDVVRGEPHGTVLIRGPQAAPLRHVLSHVVAARLAGNSVILVSPAGADLVLAALTAVAHESGLSKNTLSILPGLDNAALDSLMVAPEIDAVGLIASARGLAVARQQLATGPAGVRPLIGDVLAHRVAVVAGEAANDALAAQLLSDAFTAAGQAPHACRVVLVADNAAEPFFERLAKMAAELSVGPPERASSDVGPMSDVLAEELGLAAIAELRRRGTTGQLCVGDVPATNFSGTFVGPAIFEVGLDEVTTQVAAPVMTVARYGGEAALLEALTQLGDRRGPMQLELYGCGPRLARRVAETVRPHALRVDGGPDLVERAQGASAGRSSDGRANDGRAGEVCAEPSRLRALLAAYQRRAFVA